MGHQPLAPAGGVTRDPLVATAGLLGLILASNQPTYPLYVWLAAGEGVAKSSVVLAAVPLFLAVPWLARRHGLAARLLLPLVGVANTVVTAGVMGPQAGLEFLLLPCAALGAALFRAGERWAMLAVVLAAAAGWLLIDGLPPGDLSAPAYASLRRMNALSAIAVCGLIGWLSPAAPRLSPPPA
jgi:hypothetical protein